MARKGSAWLALVFALAAVAFGVWWYSSRPAPEAPAILPSSNCTSTPAYFIISKPRSGGAGSDIVVKYRSDPKQTFVCAYDPKPEDFEIISSDAEYFYGITGHFMLLDAGTAPPPRTLIIYDLDSRSRIFSDKYSPPVGTGNHSVSYWMPTTIPPTNVSCPNLDLYRSEGLGAEIESLVTLDLATLHKDQSGDFRCAPLQ